MLSITAIPYERASWTDLSSGQLGYAFLPTEGKICCYRGLSIGKNAPSLNTAEAFLFWA
jgi:hypothetical protein